MRTLDGKQFRSLSTPGATSKPPSDTTARSRKRLLRGFTATELIMAVGVFAVGVTGVASMQKVTSASNRHAKNLAIATAIAQSWQEHLAVDALRWRQATGMPGVTTDTNWIQGALANAGTWHLPDNPAVPEFGPGFDAVGTPLDLSTQADNVVFCTNIRLTVLLPDDNDTLGAGLLRSEVRVYWPKPGKAWNSGSNYCGTAAPSNIGTAHEFFHFVHKTTALRQTRLQ